MLIRFSVQNYRSIGGKPVVLSMVSSSKIRDHADHAVNLGSVKILRDAVVYGANAAGKSNIIHALEYLVDSLRSGHLVGGAESSYCKNMANGAEANTVFGVQYEADGAFFEYGFSCNLAQRRIEGERLCKLEGGTKKPLFERAQSKIRIHFLPRLDRDSRKRIEVYADDFEHDAENTPHRLFLAALNKGRRFDSESGLGFLAQAYSWLTQNLVVFKPDSPTHSSFLLHTDDLDRAGRLLATFDTGITTLDRQDIPIEELGKHVPPRVMDALHEALHEAAKSQPSASAITLRGGNVLASIAKEEGREPRATILKARHEGSAAPFDFGEESAGTKLLFGILDMLLTDRRDTVFIVDELSRSFHPLLTKHFIDLFNEIHAKDKCQLVFTTHENDVMSFKHFRRDEIWFIERAGNGISMLYPLDDFVAQGSVRSDTRVGKSYLEGRYGSIPVLSMEESMNVLEA